jgi:hypothetical protein
MKRKLRLMPEWSAFPVWDGGMVRPESLPISDDLRRDLQAWNDSYTDTGGVSPDVYERPADWDEAPWKESGQRLARRLEAELGPGVEVSLRMWGDS